MTARGQTIELPIFPLPGVVFFPRVILPLHIFEPRYKAMVASALDGNGRIGMVLLREGWRSQYHASPPVFGTGTMGLITQPEELEDGKYNLLLRGLQRYRILEFLQETPFRLARVRLLEDVAPDERDAQALRWKMAKRLNQLAPEIKFPPLEPKLAGRIDFLTMINLICCCLDLSVYDKQRLLETGDLAVRARGVLGVLDRKLKAKKLVSGFQTLRPEHPERN